MIANSVEKAEWKKMKDQHYICSPRRTFYGRKMSENDWKFNQQDIANVETLQSMYFVKNAHTHTHAGTLTYHQKQFKNIHTHTYICIHTCTYN